jgi:hypothetical protein
MLDFVARAFRGWMNFILWIILIGSAIVGAVFGWNINGFGFAFLFLILGAFIGLIIVILAGGLIANFLNMVDNIEKIANNSSIIQTKSNNNTSGINQNNNLPPRPTQVNYGDTWTCKNCNEKNPITSSSCKGCGEYK